MLPFPARRIAKIMNVLLCRKPRNRERKMPSSPVVAALFQAGESRKLLAFRAARFFPSRRGTVVAAVAGAAAGRAHLALGARGALSQAASAVLTGRGRACTDR